MPRRIPALAAVAAASVAALGLSGCNGYHATSPASVRKHATASGRKAFAKGAHGAVDCRKAKCVALTFDTGPSVRTPQILKILRRYHVHATFFTLGKNHVLKHPQPTRDMAAQRHELETLTWSHRILTKISKSEVRKEITEGRDAVEEVTGIRPALLRPPQGRTGGSVASVCRGVEMSEVEWSASASGYRTNDFRVDHEADT